MKRLALILGLLLLAPSAFAQRSTSNQLVASDNWASGSLSAGWSALPGFLKCQVVGSSPYYTEPNTSSTQAGQVWTGTTFSNDQTSEFTIQTLTNEANTFAQLFVRVQTGASLSGYVVDLNHDTLIAYVYNSGTPTQIGSTTVVAPASGDVWAFSIAGSALSVYQNYKRVFYFYDATWTSGSPGFGQYTASATLSHTQIASWRGYSAVQQDGIWQKQGIVIPALAGDLPSSGTQGTFITTKILYEGNAQILSGTVYKIWFGAGGTAHPGIYYAESLDGINWTRNSATVPVIAGQWGPAIIKVGSTYYLYTQPSASFGTGDFALYTSTNGITWTSVSSTVLALGSAGAWDSVAMYTFAPVTIISGTWYALYSATNSDSPAATALIGKMGLATSTDGINWTKYASNPVGNGWVTQATSQIGSLWYTWVQQCQLGQGNTIAAGLDPTETVRYSSPDLINWTKSAQSIHHSQLFEGVNTNTGQSFINSIIDVNGKAYAYTNSEPNDSAAPQVYQIGLAIASVSTAQLVKASEDGAQQIATDAFTSGSGSLDANWTLPTGGSALQIVAGPYVEPTVLLTAGVAVYTGATFSPNQYSEVTIQTLGGVFQADYLLPTVRMSTTALTFYQANIASPTGTSDAALFVQKVVAGSGTQLGPTITVEPNVSDVWRLAVTTGNDGFPTLSVFQNGFLVLQVQDQSSTPILTGKPGMQAYAAFTLSNAQIGLWAGGNMDVIQNFQTSLSNGAKLSNGTLTQ